MPNPRNTWFRGRAGRDPSGPCEVGLAEEEEDASPASGSMSAAPYRPPEEHVGLDGATVVLGGQAAGHARAERFQGLGHGVHERGQALGQVHAALEARAADMVLD